MELRKEKRFRGIKNILIIDGDKICPVTIMNISKKGFSVKSEFVFPTYKQIEIEMTIHEKHFKMLGSIRWVNEHPGIKKPNFREIGISLSNPPAEYNQLLDEILSQEEMA